MGKSHFREGKLCSDCQKHCLNGDVKNVMALLESGCKVNARTEHGSTPLMLAASRGHNNLVDALLPWNPDVNSQDLSDNTALMLACEAGHWKCVQSLLYSWSADLDRRNSTGSTALILTTSFLFNEGHLRCLKSLVEQDADLNLKNNVGMSALMYSVDSLEFGLPALKILIEAGAGIDSLDDDGESLLMLAVRKRHLSVLDYLLKHTDLDVSFTNSALDNALIIALKLATDNSQIVSSLLKAGSDANSKSGTGCSALNIAAATNFATTVLLLSNGALPKLSKVYISKNKGDYDKCLSLLVCGSIFTPIDVAVLNANYSTADFLLTFLGCRPFSLFDSYRAISLNDQSECGGPVKFAVHEMISMAKKCPAWVDKARAYMSLPKSLVQCCMAVISKMAGTLPGRHDRLIASGLPPVLVKNLFVIDVDEKDFVI